MQISKLCHLPLLLVQLEPKGVLQYVTVLLRSSKINNGIPSSLRSNFSSFFSPKNNLTNSHFLSHKVSVAPKSTENADYALLSLPMEGGLDLGGL